MQDPCATLGTPTVYRSIPFRSTVYLGIAFLGIVSLTTGDMVTAGTREDTTCGGGSCGMQGIGTFALDVLLPGEDTKTVLRIRERRTRNATTVNKG